MKGSRSQRVSRVEVVSIVKQGHNLLGGVQQQEQVRMGLVWYQGSMIGWMRSLARSGGWRWSVLVGRVALSWITRDGLGLVAGQHMQFQGSGRDEEGSDSQGREDEKNGQVKKNRKKIKKERKKRKKEKRKEQKKKTYLTCIWSLVIINKSRTQGSTGPVFSEPLLGSANTTGQHSPFFHVFNSQ